MASMAGGGVVMLFFECRVQGGKRMGGFAG